MKSFKVKFLLTMLSFIMILGQITAEASGVNRTVWSGEVSGHSYYGCPRGTVNIIYQPTSSSINVGVSTLNGFGVTLRYSLDTESSVIDSGSINHRNNNQGTVFYRNVTGLSPDKQYKLKFLFTDVSGGSTGCSTDSNNWREYTIYTVPNNPSALTATSVGTETAVLRWNTNGNPADTNYTVERRYQNANGTWSGWALVRTVNTGNYENIGLLEGTKYEFRVSADGKNGTKYYSNTISLTTIMSKAGEAAQAAKEAKDLAGQAKQSADNANQKATDVQNIINNTVIPKLNLLDTQQTNFINSTNQKFNEISNKLAEFNSTQNEFINNVQNMFPPTLSKVSGYNNATAT